MKKITIIFCLIFIGLSFSNISAQSKRVPQDTTKKANERPAETVSQAKINGEEIGEVDDDDIVRIDTNIVSVPVKIINRKGTFVSGLTKEDFQVFEDKVEQEIALFSNEEDPFTVALVLDMSYSSNFKIKEIQFAAIEFIDQLRRNDKVMVVSFDGEVHLLSPPTNDRKALYKAIYKTEISSGTSLYDAIDMVINKEFKKVSGRKAIVLFTDGVDTTSQRSYSTNNLRDAMEFDALIYPIQYDTFRDVQAMQDGSVVVEPTVRTPLPPKNKSPFPFPIPTSGIGIPSGQGTTAEEYKQADEYLNEMANRTGGRLYKASTTGNLAEAFANIAEELRSYYSIGYYPKEAGKSGDIRKLKVKVKKGGVSVRAKDSYIVGNKEKK